MGGVGTFSRDNRTLYLGGIRRVKGVDVQELIVRNFIEVALPPPPIQVAHGSLTHVLVWVGGAGGAQQWGELESVRVIWDKSIAFVRYKLRAAAEFAKEAMADQVQ